MPRIPEYQRRETLPGRTGKVAQDPARAGRVSGAVSKAIGTVGDVLAQRQQIINARVKANKEITFRNAFDEEARAFRTTELEKIGPDSYDNLNRAKKFSEESISKYTADIEDPDLQLSIKEYIGRQSSQLMDKLASHQAAQLRIDSQKVIGQTLEGILRDVGDGAASIPEAVQKLRETIAAQNIVENLDDPQAIAWIEEGETQIAKAQIESLLNLDPELAASQIEQGAYNEYLPQDELQKYKNEATRIYKAIERDKAQAEKEERRIAKEELAKRREQINNDFELRLLAGDLTEADVLRSSLAPEGSLGSKRQWFDRIERRREKLKKLEEKKEKEAWETKPVVYAEFLEKVHMNPAEELKQQIFDSIGSGLSTADGDSLIKTLQSKLKKTKDKTDDPLKSFQAKTAFRILNDLKTGKLYDENKEKNSLLWADDTKLLEAFIVNNPDEDPVEFVEKMRAPLVEKKIDGWWDALRFTSAEREEAAAERRMELERAARPAGEREIIQKYRDAGVSEEDYTDDAIMEYYRANYGE